MKGFQTKAIKFETFAEEWFNEYAKINLRNTTYERLLQLRGRIYPAIGHLRMDKITPRHIQAFVNSLSQEGANERTGKALSRKTMVHYLSFISTVIDFAVKMDMLSDNPCRRVSIPKGPKKERKILTIEETEKFFELLKTAPLKYQAFFILDIYSGFRRGELLGLEWKDIDWNNNVISVRRTSNYTAEKRHLYGHHENEEVAAFSEIPTDSDGLAQELQGRTR